MAEFRMPSLGADMTEGTLLEWEVHPGDEVHRGDIVAVVDTDKAAIEVECFQDGVVDELLVQPGTKVPVGTALARIREAGAAPTAPAPAPLAAPGPVVPVPAVAVSHVESPLVRRLAHERGVDLAGVVGSGPDGEIKRADVESATRATLAPPAVPAARGVHASPLARRRAAELGVDLGQVIGTGPHGVVTVGDVERSVGAAPSAPAEPPAPKPSSAAAADRSAAMRRAIGELMARSKREIPHYYLSTTVDLTAATQWLHEANAGRPITERLVPAALLLCASARAVHTVPALNGWWTDDAFHPSEHVNLGVAVSLRGGGLVAPAILDADTLGVDELMTRLRDLVTRARAGRLRGREMADGTITVTNLGDNGAEAVYGVIYAPQVALVGIGRVTERAVASGGLVGARPTVTVTLAADHRVTDGHDGSRYLAAIDDLLQKPEKL